MSAPSTNPSGPVSNSSGQALPPGTRLEEFVIERVIGSGGFGITYLARDGKLGRRAVIKENLPVQFAFRDPSSLTVSPRHSHGEDTESFRWSLENFEKEAAMLASLDHPGIVKVHRSFEAFGTAYFVMPFVEGTALDGLIRTRFDSGESFAEEEIAALLRRTLDALDYLHAQEIYHRDIKPGNLLVTEGGAPVLIDFGAARHRLVEKSLTVVESPGYTPYEQLQTRGRLGPWSDLYALGATLHKAITDETPAKSADRFPEDPLRPLAERRELASLYGEAILCSIDRALRLRIEDRWQAAGDWLGSIGRSGRNGGSSNRAILLGGAPEERSAPGREDPKPSEQPGRRVPSILAEAKAFMGNRAGEWRDFGGVEMVWCPPGQFWMGSGEGDERRHRVTLTKGFWLASQLCTQGLWEEVMDHNPSWFGRFRRRFSSMGAGWAREYRMLPVESVSWAGVHEWLARMNKRHPLPGRWRWDLPSEAQWEYACRAGTTGEHGGTGDLDEMGWHLSNSQGSTQTVGGKGSNAWGLFDMHGNVWELCRDWYAEYPAGPVTDPTGPRSGSKRVCRGGSWNSPAHRCRSSSRGRSSRNEEAGWGYSGIRFSRMGFRPAALPAED